MNWYFLPLSAISFGLLGYVLGDATGWLRGWTQRGDLEERLQLDRQPPLTNF